MEEQFEEEQEYYAIRPNKTQIKREIAELHKLVEEIVVLSPQQLLDLELPENAFEAVKKVAGMPHKSARKRQIKFLTGLFRKLEVEPIEEKLAKIKYQSAIATKEHHFLEYWRDRLIKEDDSALTQLIVDFPDADRQQLRQLLRNVKKETDLNKPPKSTRLVYQYLKKLFSEKGAES